METELSSFGFSRPDASDQRGWLWVVTILSAIYSITFLGARLFVKYGHLGQDDVVIAIAYVVAAARWGTTMKAFTLGLGAALSQTTPHHASISALAALNFWSRIALLTCHWVCKASVAIFTRRLFSGDKSHEKVMFSIASMLLAVSGVAAVLLNSISCSAESVVLGNLGHECSGGDVRRIIVCAMDIVSEVALFALPAILLIPLQTSWRNKRKVLLYYSSRLGVIALSVAQTIAFFAFLHHGHASIGLSRALILQELLLCYSLVSATIPCMRPFVGAFAGPGLGAHTATATSEAYEMQSAQTMKAPASGSSVDQERLRLRPGSWA